MHNINAIFRRELAGYFFTPVAYILIVVFLMLAGSLTFYLSNFFERGQADLIPFFLWHPWLYLFFTPAVSMRLWAEERREGTLELLMTLPITPWEAVLGKFLAAWCFISIALTLTFPLWITANYLGDPDNGAIFTAYIGSLWMAGGFLAIGSCMSALTRNQVIAFVLSVSVCFLFILSGFPLVLDFFNSWTPAFFTDLISSFSFLFHFDTLAKGVIDLRNIIYFGSLIALWLLVTTAVLVMKRG